MAELPWILFINFPAVSPRDTHKTWTKYVSEKFEIRTQNFCASLTGNIHKWSHLRIKIRIMKDTLDFFSYGDRCHPSFASCFVSNNRNVVSNNLVFQYQIDCHAHPKLLLWCSTQKALWVTSLVLNTPQ